MESLETQLQFTTVLRRCNNYLLHQLYASYMFHRMSVKAICIFPMHENLFITSVQAITIQVFTSKLKKIKKIKIKVLILGASVATIAI